MKTIALSLILLVWAAPVCGEDSPKPGAVIYTAENAPEAAELSHLPRLSQVSRFGITWHFEAPAPVGRFVNGDWYVVGPVVVTAIEPRPAAGRNGSMLNIPIPHDRFEGKVGFDSRVPHGRYDAELFQAPPLALKPGDALVSSISVAEDAPTDKQKVMLWNDAQCKSFLRIAAVLTCLAEPVPADAFRPAYADRSQKIYLARNLRRDLLATLEPVAGMPDPAAWAAMVERPWLDVVMDEFGAPRENMPVYGREFSRVTSIATLLLAMDIPAGKKEPLLIGITQVGIDLWGLVRAGKPGWPPLGGHGNGRKWPILFTGMMLGDETMTHPLKTYPKLVFSEDRQTMFADGWTGAKVVYAGHVGPEGLPTKKGWGAYEHLPPEQWAGTIGESYRRCCTSKSWVGTALAVRIYKAAELWDHDAFLVYADRWMNEDDSEHVRIIREKTGANYDNDWARQGMVWDPFVKNLWQRYRGPVDPSSWRRKD